MKITFLGTGTSTGIPMIGCDCEVCQSDDSKDKRTRCSVYIETGQTKLVIDTGPDFREQMLREGFGDVDAILFTHAHKDHIAGLDDIRPINYLKKKVIEVHATTYTAGRLKQEFPYIFEGDYPGVPMIDMKIFDSDIFKVKEIEVIPIKVKHADMDVHAFRIGDFTYLTDADTIADEELEKIKGSRIFVINALRQFSHYSHFTLDEALEIIKKVGAEQSYLIHMGHLMGKHAEVERRLPPNVYLSYDGLKVKIQD